MKLVKSKANVQARETAELPVCRTVPCFVSPGLCVRLPPVGSNSTRRLVRKAESPRFVSKYPVRPANKQRTQPERPATSVAESGLFLVGVCSARMTNNHSY